jgi:hypothetical protein
MNSDNKTHSLDELTRDLRARNSRAREEVADRLRITRQDAVALVDRPRRTTRFWIPAGFATSAAAVLVTIALAPPPDPGVEGIEPLPINLAADELAVINDMDVLEDLEFLAWMEEEASSAASG